MSEQEQSSKEFKPLIGADVEFLLFDNSVGRVTPSCGLFGGTKDKPLKVEDYEGYTFHEDNVTLEMGIPPAKNRNEFYKCLSTARMLASNIAHRANNDLSLYDKSYAEFAARDLDNDKAREIGCDEDFSAYNDDPYSPRAIGLQDLGNFRYAGAHIHVDLPEWMPAHIAAQFMDLFVCVPAIAHEQDQQRGRREAYGRPGLFRPKDYGVEYRSMSSNIMSNDDTLFGITYNVGRFYQQVSKGLDSTMEFYEEINWDMIYESILHEDRKQCETILGILNNS